MDKEKDSKKEELMDRMEASKERQKFQMHQKGYNDIVTAISSIKIPEIELPEMPEMDMSETNAILSKLVDAVKEDITIELVIK